MPDIWFDVDVALAEVPVNTAPLVDATDGKTIEDSLVYNEAGMDLNWNFVTTAGAMTHTNVVPTTSGVHDWTNQGNGMYSLEIPDTGGTINNDTEGFGWFSGVTTASLPWRGPVCGFRAAALNNALIDGGDELDVNVTKIADTTQTANDIGADIQTMVDGIITGQAQTGTLSTTEATTNLTGYTVDQLIGRTLTWTSGPPDGEQTDITDYVVTNGHLTFTAITVAPQNGNTFKIT